MYSCIQGIEAWRREGRYLGVRHKGPELDRAWGVFEVDIGELITPSSSDSSFHLHSSFCRSPCAAPVQGMCRMVIQHRPEPLPARPNPMSAVPET